MTDPARDPVVEWFASMRETSKPLLEWALDASKLALPGAILAGSFFVFAYLQSVGAPLPTADLPAMTSLFLSILLLFGAFATGCAALVLLPAVMCSTPDILRQRINAGAPLPSGIMRAALRQHLSSTAASTLAWSDFSWDTQPLLIVRPASAVAP